MSIQGSSQKAVTAMEAITGAVKELSDLTTNIASAIEEQAVATREISGHINNVSAVASETGSKTAQFQTMSDELSRIADWMRTDIENFINDRDGTRA